MTERRLDSPKRAIAPQKWLWMLLGSAVMLLMSSIFACHAHVIEWLLPFVEGALSADHQLTPEGILFFSRIFRVMVVSLFLLGAASVAFSIPCLRRWVGHLASSETLSVGPNHRRLARYVFVASSSLAILVILIRCLSSSAILSTAVGEEDGFLEGLSAVLFFLSFVLLAAASLRPGRALQGMPQRAKRGVRIGYFLIATVLLFVAMEEISWGQRIFGWETPEVMKTLNTQDETNLHNTDMIGSIVYYAGYRFAGVFLAVASILAWTLLWDRRGIRLIVPHPELIGVIVLLLLFTVVWVNSEFVEELFSIFFGFYALRVTAMRASTRPSSVS
jgi:hypothetical protein